MGKRKKIKKKIVFYLANKLGWLLVLALGRSSLIRPVGRHHLINLINKGKPFMFVLWHGRMLIPIYYHRNQGIVPMVSLHQDGEMIAQTVQRLGYRTVRGSSGRGGKKAFHDMVDALKQGNIGAILPDGPRGPRHQLKPGAIYIAQQSGAYLLPITFSAKSRVIFNSWDKFMLPLPFSKNVLLYGAPIRVPEDSSQEQLEQIRQDFETAMIELEKKADAYFQ